MRSTLRAFAATVALCLFAAACGEGTTDPGIRVPVGPALDGIGVVGGGGRLDDSTTSVQPSSLENDSRETVSSPTAR